MTRPLLRWTVGSVSDAGYEVLKASIRITRDTLSKFKFDYAICCNNQSPARLEWLKTLGVDVIEQNWSMLPIEHGMVPHKDREVVNAIWKVCPARVRPESHEIILDNDVILTRIPSQLQEFMDCNNAVLMLEDPLRWFGHYDHRLAPGLAINTGIIGLPPYYEFGREINEHWVGNGCKPNNTLADEQGLLALTIMESDHNKLTIAKTDVIELHPNGIWYCWDDAFKNLLYKFTGKESGFHFVEINRKPNHTPWEHFKQCTLFKKITL